MELRLNDEQKMIAESAAQVLQERSSGERVRQVLEQGGLDRALWQEACALGWTALAVPEQAGGMGLGLTELVLLQEQLGWHLACIPFFDAVVAPAPLWRHLAQHGGASGLVAVERLALSGQICVLGMAVDGSLAAPARLQRRAEGGWQLDGTWPQVASAAHADVLLLPAQLPEGDCALVALPVQATGLQLQPQATVDGTRSSAWVQAAQVQMAPEDVLLHGEALAQLWEPLRQHAAIGLAAEQVGVADRALQLAVAYTGERQQFGKPVGSFQAVKHRAAQMLVQVELARSAVYEAAFLADAPDAAIDLLLHAAQARMQATQAALFCTRECIQLHGGVGFTWEYDPHLYFRRAQAGSQRMGTVAQWLEQTAAQLLDRQPEAQEAVA